MDGFHAKYDSRRKPQIYFSQVMCDGMYAICEGDERLKKIDKQIDK